MEYVMQESDLQNLEEKCDDEGYANQFLSALALPANEESRDGEPQEKDKEYHIVCEAGLGKW
jgi:hypothetical protein